MDADELKVLQKGLKFTPTPKNNASELNTDVQEFCRKIRLKEYFADTESSDDPSLVKNRSSFNPPKGRDKDLDRFVDALSKFPTNTQQNSKIRHNLSKGERTAMNLISSDSSIIIKQADKGGAIVIMDSDYYKQKVEELLLDEEYYREIPENIDPDTMKKNTKTCFKAFYVHNSKRA